MRQRSGYALLDSGGDLKLEQFGSRRVIRPSSIALWSKRLPQGEWECSDARYEHGRGWICNGEVFESWHSEFDGIKLELRLQRNGQVGLFPEHLNYLRTVKSIFDLGNRRPRALKVLNLFAYTGLGSIIAAYAGAEVTHVDLAKATLTWSTKNISLNAIDPKRIRFIAEDALQFVARESRRGNLYDIVILDPPSFSRISKSETWDLEDVILSLVTDCKSILNPTNGALLFSSHHQALDNIVISNLLEDLLHDRQTLIEGKPLVIPEQNSKRLLPSGSVVLCRYGEFASIPLTG